MLGERGGEIPDKIFQGDEIYKKICLCLSVASYSVEPWY